MFPCLSIPILTSRSLILFFCGVPSLALHSTTVRNCLGCCCLYSLIASFNPLPGTVIVSLLSNVYSYFSIPTYYHKKMNKKIKQCGSCNELLKFYRTFKKCVNLGCVDYNKHLRRYDAVHKKREEKKIPGQKNKNKEVE